VVTTAIIKKKAPMIKHCWESPRKISALLLLERILVVRIDCCTAKVVIRVVFIIPVSFLIEDIWDKDKAHVGNKTANAFCQYQFEAVCTRH
jgi:hypothetical protein